MTGTTGRSLLITVVFVLLLAACSKSPAPQTAEEPSPTSEPAVEPTSTPQPTTTPEPTNSPEPTSSLEQTPASQLPPSTPPGVQTMEAILAPPFALGELATYQVESTGLTFDYPAGWIVSEDASGVIRVESEVDYADRVDTDAGAAVAIIPMGPDDVPGQDSLEKLASYILSAGTTPSLRLGDPTTMMLNNQELTFSAFVDQSLGLEGVFAAILTENDLVVVFAVAGGANRTSYRPAVETIVNSLVLPEAEQETGPDSG